MGANYGSLCWDCNQLGQSDLNIASDQLGLWSEIPLWVSWQTWSHMELSLTGRQRKLSQFSNLKHFILIGFGVWWVLTFWDYTHGSCKSVWYVVLHTLCFCSIASEWRITGIIWSMTVRLPHSVRPGELVTLKSREFFDMMLSMTPFPGCLWWTPFDAVNDPFLCWPRECQSALNGSNLPLNGQLTQL